MTTELGSVSAPPASQAPSALSPVPRARMAGGVWARARVAMAGSVITCQARVGVPGAGLGQTVAARVQVESSGLGVSTRVIVIMEPRVTQWMACASANPALRETGERKSWLQSCLNC